MTDETNPVEETPTVETPTVVEPSATSEPQPFVFDPEKFEPAIKTIAATMGLILDNLETGQNTPVDDFSPRWVFWWRGQIAGQRVGGRIELGEEPTDESLTFEFARSAALSLVLFVHPYGQVMNQAIHAAKYSADLFKAVFYQTFERAIINYMQLNHGLRPGFHLIWRRVIGQLESDFRPTVTEMISTAKRMYDEEHTDDPKETLAQPTA